MSEDLKKFDDLEGLWPEEPVEVNDSNFDKAVKDYSLVVIDCWAPWCGPCRMIAPTIDAMAKDYHGKVLFGKLNTDNNQNTAMKYRIMGIPTLLIFKDGEHKDSIVGAVPREAIEQKLKTFM